MDGSTDIFFEMLMSILYINSCRHYKRKGFFLVHSMRLLSPKTKKPAKHITRKDNYRKIFLRDIEAVFLKLAIQMEHYIMLMIHYYLEFILGMFVYLKINVIHHIEGYLIKII